MMFIEDSVTDIAPIVYSLRQTFESNVTKPIQWRKDQIRRLTDSIEKNKKLLEDAYIKDLNRDRLTLNMMEFSMLFQEIGAILKNLDKWTKPYKRSVGPIFRIFLSPSIQLQPLGVVLVIGAFNYPALLSLQPLLGAIAAGCPAIVKLPELTPNISAVLKHIIDDALDKKAYRALNGGKELVEKLLEYQFGHILYTGGETVGRIVAEKAGRTLTPITLELGGKSPVFITSEANLESSIKRIMVAKMANSGQLCVTPDYIILTDPNLQSKFTAAVQKVVKDNELEFSEEDTQIEGKYVKIVNKQHTERLKKLLDESPGGVITGGTASVEDQFVNLTVKFCTIDDPLMKSEIFGPILPVVVTSDIEEAIKTYRQICKTPLAAYIFGSNKEADYMIDRIQCANISINSCAVFLMMKNHPFGGVGTAGIGNYRFRNSLRRFSYERVITQTPSNKLFDQIFESFLPPPTEFKEVLVKFFTFSNNPTLPIWVQISYYLNLFKTASNIALQKIFTLKK